MVMGIISNMDRQRIVNEMTNTLMQRYGAEYALGYMTKYLTSLIDSPNSSLDEMRLRLSMIIEECTE